MLIPNIIIMKNLSQFSFQDRKLSGGAVFRVLTLMILILLSISCNKEPDELPGPFDPIENPELVDGIENLGSGYDVFDQFADASKVKATVLDYNALNDDGLVEMKTLEHSTFHTTSGTSILEYSNSLSISVGVSGSYMFFSGSIKTNFSESRYSYDSYSFATYHSMINKYQLRIPTDRSANDLKPYLTSQAKSKLNDPLIDPYEIFRIYGTHCLSGVVVGGRLDYSISARTRDIKENVSIGVYAEASFSIGLGSGSMNTEVIDSSEYAQFASSMEKHLEVYGGSSELGQHIINKDDYDSWIGSIGSNLVFCNYTQNGLIPIWNFCEEDSRKAQLEAAFASWATEREIPVNPAPKACILDVKVFYGENLADPYKINGRDYYRLPYNLNAGLGNEFDAEDTWIYYLPGMENDTMAPIAEICTLNETDGEVLEDLPEGFVKIENSLNPYYYYWIANFNYYEGDDIFLAYRRRNDYADALVTGLGLSIDSENVEVSSFGTSESNTWYALTKGYTSPDKQNLKEGILVFGDNTEDYFPMDLYLYFTNDYIEEQAFPGYFSR